MTPVGVLSRSCVLLLAFVFPGLRCIAGPPDAQGAWRAPDPTAIQIPARDDAPMLACTAEELERLRAAWRGKDAAGAPVRGLVKRARKRITEPLVFPARGGQHNQWYQCDACQLALKTIDDTHHRCPKCRKVYSGAPYDDVIFSRIHLANAAAARNAAWAWRITGEPAFAAWSARVLLGYAERYSSYPYHTNHQRNGRPRGTSGGHIKEQTLSEASLLVGALAPAVDLIRDSPALDEETRETLRQELILPMLENLDQCKRGKSNWQSWHNAAMVWGGVLLDDVAWVRKALFQKGNGFLFQMDACVSDEGMWYENSWGYHFYTLRALEALVVACERVGVDLWEHPRFARMYTLPLTYEMADGTLPRFGDAVDTPLRAHAARFEVGYAHWKDERLRSVLPRKASWDSVRFGRDVLERTEPTAWKSHLVKGAGHALLRRGGEAGLTAALTWSPYGGFHGHLDKLSFVLFGHGRELAVDPGRARSQAYRLPIHKHWYKATISHNAVLVGGKGQKGTGARVTSFVDKADYVAVASRVEDAWPNAVHRRVLLLTDDHAIVLDRIEAEEETTFDCLLHLRGGTFEGVGLDPEAEPPQGLDLRFIELSAGTPELAHGWRGKIAVDELTCDVHVSTDGPLRIWTGTGAGASTLERIPLLIARRRGKSASFASLIEPHPRPSEAKVRGVELTQNGEEIVVELATESGTRRLHWRLADDGLFVD